MLRLALILSLCFVSNVKAQVVPGWEVIGNGCGGVLSICPDLLPASIGWLGEEYLIDSTTNANCLGATGFQIIRIGFPWVEAYEIPIPLPGGPGCFTYFNPWITDTAYNSSVRWGLFIPLDSSLNGMTLAWQAIHVREHCNGDCEFLSTRAILQTYAINPDNPPQ